MKRLILIVSLVVAAVAATAMPAQAVGSLPYSEAQATCWVDADQFDPWRAPLPRIEVTAPNMRPLGEYVLVPGGGGSNITTPTQNVGFRVTVMRWSGSKWYAYWPTTEWKWAVATVNDGTPQWTTWTGLTSGARGNGTQNFRINHQGVYKVFVEYYWWKNQYLPSASTAAYITPLNFYDYTRGYMGTSPGAACYF